MAPSDAGSGSPWSFLWGKRRARRHDAVLPVEVWARGAQVRALTRDVSATGTRVRVLPDDLAAVMPGGGAFDIPALHEIFSEPFVLRFPGRRLELRAELVRVAPDDAHAGAIVLGCRFQDRLAPDVLARLGVPASDGGAEAGTSVVPAERMTWQPVPDQPLAVRVLPTDGGMATEAIVGRLLGVSDSMLALRVSGLDETEVAASLGRQQFVVRVTRGTSAIHTSPAFLLAVRPLGGAEEGIEVVVQCLEAPGAAVTSHLRRNAVASVA